MHIHYLSLDCTRIEVSEFVRAYDDEIKSCQIAPELGKRIRESGLANKYESLDIQIRDGWVVDVRRFKVEEPAQVETAAEVHHLDHDADNHRFEAQHGCTRTEWSAALWADRTNGIY